MTFRQHMEDAVTSALAEFPAEPDVYTVTFRIDSVDQDPRHPYLAVGYNTETEVARARSGPNPPDPWEARWSYAYFPPSGLEGVRSVGHDPHGAALYRAEAVDQGLWQEDERLDELFRELCVDLARHLHTSGLIAATFGRPLPVILYDMFDPDAMFALTAAANPAELVTDFMTEAVDS